MILLLYLLTVIFSFFTMILKCNHEDFLVAWDYALAGLISLLPVVNVIVAIMYLFVKEETPQDCDSCYDYYDHVEEDYPVEEHDTNRNLS